MTGLLARLRRWAAVPVVRGSGAPVPGAHPSWALTRAGAQRKADRIGPGFTYEWQVVPATEVPR